MAIVEIGAADRDVVRRGCDTVDLKPAVGDLLRVEVFASGRSAVARRHEHRLPLRGGLLPERAPEGVAALAQIPFALGVADADDAGLIVGHRAIGGQSEPVAQGRAGRGVKNHRGAGRNRVSGFDVEIRLGGRAVFAGIGAVHHHLRQVGAQTEERLVGLDQA